MATNNQTVIVSTRGELDLIVFESVQSTLKVLIPDFIKEVDKRRSEPSEGSEQLISKRCAAQKLGCSVSTVDNLRRTGKLTRIKVGRSTRFRLADVQAMMKI